MQFDSIDSFTNFLSMVIVPNIPGVLHGGLHEVGEAVVDSAKDKFGTYQKSVYTFPAWADLAPRTLVDNPENTPLLRSGDTRDSIGFEVNGDDVVVGSSEPTMIYHELGTKSEPPRPVLGPAMYEARQMIRDIMGKATVLAIAPHMKLTKVAGFKRTGPRLSNASWDQYRPDGGD